MNLLNTEAVRTSDRTEEGKTQDDLLELSLDELSYVAGAAGQHDIRKILFKMKLTT